MQPSRGTDASLHALKRDSEHFLSRHGNGYRASCYRPTLAQFTSMTFEEYIRVNVLGVPLPGFTLEYPFSESDDESNCNVNETADSKAFNVGQSIDKNTLEPRIRRIRSPAVNDIHSIERQSCLEHMSSAKSRINTRKNRTTARNVHPKTKLRIDPTKYSDGIAKITPPEGWWTPSYLLNNENIVDSDGIAPSRNAGPTWEEGTTLGDILIPSPIKQCISGIGGIYEFTMLELPSMTVAKYRNLAEEYKQRQVHSRSRFLSAQRPSGTGSVDDQETDEQMDELARFYWRRLGPTMEASVYGADMAGTLFREDTACGWNVAKLDTCLQLIRADRSRHADILGVTSPYLYFGMWASSFAAHVEDMNLCSINYLHAGAPKYWYSISAEDTDRFETLMASYFFDASGSCSEFMRHKRYLLSPSILNKAGITYTTQIQRAGDFIITFPGCYHFGFNTGFNVAESTNFAIPEWVPIGEKANVCLCRPDSVRIDTLRFATLLNDYEECRHEKKITYIEWAKAEDRRRRDKVTSPPHICKSATVVQSQGFVVDVYKKSSDYQTVVGNLCSSKKRKNRRTEYERRLARISGKASFVKGTAVICLLPSSLNKELKYFSGVIEKILEDNLRIHFDGESRKKDIWIPVDSKNLFLDGGSAS